MKAAARNGRLYRITSGNAYEQFSDYPSIHVESQAYQACCSRDDPSTKQETGCLLFQRGIRPKG